MTALRAVVLCASFGVGLFTGCYTERLPPPTYRYPCDAADDCPEGEGCIQGLCQIGCTQATFAMDCPQDGSYLACLNGVCASGCDVENDPCPGELQCIDLGLEVSGGGFFGGGGDSETIGVCGRLCEADDADACPSGEACVQGFCVVTCDPAADPDPCPDGLVCTLGLCIPELVDVDLPPGGSDGSAAATTDGGATGTSTAGTATGGGQ